VIAYVVPTTVETMNYNSVILAGVIALTGIWWLAHAVRHYPGPKVMTMYIHDDSHAGAAATVHEGVFVGGGGDGANVDAGGTEKAKDS